MTDMYFPFKIKVSMVVEMLKEESFHCSFYIPEHIKLLS